MEIKETETLKNEMAIQLGDVIRIISSTNVKFHEKTFLVYYCGKDKLILFDIDSGEELELKMEGQKHLYFEEKEGIQTIELLSRREEPGFARQNGLVLGTWIDVEFGGDLPLTVTGLITNLEEDQIEITTYPDNDVFYLDFQYEGLEHIIPPIEKIQIRESPTAKTSEENKEKAVEGQKAEVKNDNQIENLVDGEKEEEANMAGPLAHEQAEQNTLEILQDEYVQGLAYAKSLVPEIEYGDVLGKYYQKVEQRKEDMRFSVSTQLDDLMNEMLSTIPTALRTPKVMEEIETTLVRFRELHTMFAKYNTSGVVVGYRSNRHLGKPVVSKVLGSGEESVGGDGEWNAVKWIMPVVQLRKKIWHDLVADETVEDMDPRNNDEDGYFNVFAPEFFDDGKHGNDETIQNPMCVWMQAMENAHSIAFSNLTVANENSTQYDKYLGSVDDILQPYVNPNDRSLNRNMFTHLLHVGSNLEAVVDNAKNLDAPKLTPEPTSLVAKAYSDITMGKDEIILKPTKYVVQKYTDAITIVKQKWVSGGRKTLEQVPAMESETMYLKSVLLLPESVAMYSAVDLPGTDVMTRSNLAKWFPQLSRLFRGKMEKTVVDDLTKEISYGSLEERCPVVYSNKRIKRGIKQKAGNNEKDTADAIEFLSDPREYILANQNVGIEPSLRMFLNTIVPNNIYIIDMVCPYLNGEQYSIHSYAKLLEPFGINIWNLKHKEATVIQKKIREKIAEYRVITERKRKEYLELVDFVKKQQKWEKEHYQDAARFYHWIRKRGKDFIDTFLGWYHLSTLANVGISTGEILNRIMHFDGGQLLNSVHSYLNYSLITSEIIMEKSQGGMTLNYGASTGTETGGYGIFQPIAGLRFLAKRYRNVKELHADDFITNLYADKDLDPSPYHLVEEYGNETSGESSETNSALTSSIIPTATMEGAILHNRATENIKIMGDQIEKIVGGMDEPVETQFGGEGGSGPKTMRQKMNTEQFLEYMVMNLRDRHFCPEEEAVELAGILISGKRPLKDGDYASVIFDDGTVGYYKRSHHTWTRDVGLDIAGENMSENMMFYNLGKNDPVVEHSGKKVVSLTGNPKHTKRNKMLAKGGDDDVREGGTAEGGAKDKAMIKEVARYKIQQSLKELEVAFEENMRKQIIRTSRIYSIAQMDLKKHNNFAYYFGKYKGSKTEIAVESPQAKFLELVLEEPDFGLKQAYIVRFYNAFCREAILTKNMRNEFVENKHWKYCYETNQPLLPTSYYVLAVEYMSKGMSGYAAHLDILCSEIGDKSADGDAIIDKYTGRVLRKIDFDVEEGYDDNGFRIQTRAELDEGDEENKGPGTNDKERDKFDEDGATEIPLPIDPGIEEETDTILEKINDSLTRKDTAVAIANQSKRTKTARDYGGEGDNELIARVVLYYMQEMGLLDTDILLNDIMPFVFEIVSPIMAEVTQTKFDKIAKQAAKLNKPLAFATYTLFRNNELLYATVGALLIAIQTVTVPIKMSKNNSSCIRALKGYPTAADSSEPTAPLKYMVCILQQQQSDEEPWTSRIKSKKEETHAQIVSKIISKLAENPVVKIRIASRRTFEAEQGADAGFREVEVISTAHCLPPYERKLHVEVGPVGNGFYEVWLQEIRRTAKAETKRGGSKEIVLAKLSAAGLVVFEQINAEVKKQSDEFLLKTVSGVPFLENACCQGEATPVLAFFYQKNPLIKQAMTISQGLSTALYFAEQPKKSVCLYHNTSTRFGNGIFWDLGNSNSYYKKNIYDAIIHYFHYKTPLLPVPYYMRGAYDEPPKGFPVDARLEEQIEYLEKEGRHYTVEKLQQCMTLIGQQNILSTDRPVSDAAVDLGVGNALGDFLTSMEFEIPSSSAANSTALQQFNEMTGYLAKCYAEWKKGVMQNMASKNIRILNNFLGKSNQAMFARISEFMNARTEEDRGFLIQLENIQSWEIEGDDSLQQIARFIRVMCDGISMVNGRIAFSFHWSNTSVPKHWGFADQHISLLESIIQKARRNIKNNISHENYNQLDIFMSQMREKERTLFSLIRRLLSHFPVFTPLSARVQDKDQDQDQSIVFYSLFPRETCLGVFVHCLYLIFTTYIDAMAVENLVAPTLLLRRREADEDGPMRSATPMSTISNNIPEPNDEYTAHEGEEEIRQVLDGQRSTMKQLVVNFLFGCIKMEVEKKTTVNISYSQLRKEQEKTEQREKKRITDRLQVMQIHERKVETQLKNLKLGDWAVGLEKGLYKYDKETFVREMYEQRYGLESGGIDANNDDMIINTNNGDLQEDYLVGNDNYDEVGRDFMDMGEDWHD